MLLLCEKGEIFMNNSFEVGDKVEVKDFFGKVIRKTEVTEITGGGNIRVKDYRGLFHPDGSERRKSMFWTDRIYINKVEKSWNVPFKTLNRRQVNEKNNGRRERNYY